PRHLALDSFGTGGRCYPLFGSGSAGLGIVETAVPLPHWTFSARTREEKAVLFALRMMVVEHSRGRGGAREVLQDIITGYEEHLPFAREIVTNMERMTTAEREAFIAGNSSREKKLEL